MSNQFLKEIHQFVTKKITDASAAMDKAEADNSGDDRQVKYYEGKLSEFRSLRVFMDENFNLTNHSYH